MATPIDSQFIALQSALAGQYSLERELGRGGMGVVYLAREVQLDRLVAIKVLPPDLAVRADLRERFLREARTAARLSHPNIVPIFRVGEVGGSVFFAMAYVDGETLTQRVRARGPLPPHEATRLIQEIAWALAYAHARGVVHRDIKPDNILLEKGTRRALVTDFGIAHIETASGLTEVGQVMGTAHFMSPEQAAGEALDGRSDLYSLGVVAHFALTGKLPFDGPTVQAILAKHLTQAPPPVVAVNASVPKGLARAVDRCLAKTPAERYASGEELAEAITAAEERRRELPAAVRVWLQKGEVFKVPYAVYVCTVGFLAITTSTGWISTPLKFLLPFAAYVLLDMVRTRRLFAAGYDRATLLAALREHIEQRREEMAFEFGRKPPLIWRVVRYLTYGFLAGAAASAAGIYFRFPVIPLQPYFYTEPMFFALSYFTLVGASIGLVKPGRRLEEHNLVSAHRLRLWSGRFGEWLAKLTSFRLAPSASAIPIANRPTEVAIGLAAADLYAALPKAVQQKLRDLPAAVRRLEEIAQATRTRVDELSARLADAADTPLLARSASLDQFGGGAEVAEQQRRLLDDLRSARDEAGRQLATTVAALENIRLDLLRLQAGAGSVESLTAALEGARRLSDDVDQVIAGRDLADEALGSTPTR
jgi:serine/threonine-protein kinase